MDLIRRLKRHILLLQSKTDATFTVVIDCDKVENFIVVDVKNRETFLRRFGSIFVTRLLKF